MLPPQEVRKSGSRYRIRRPRSRESRVPAKEIRLMMRFWTMVMCILRMPVDIPTRKASIFTENAKIRDEMICM